MKRLLKFDFVEDAYVIQENSLIVFSINESDLQFDSRKFYEGIYNGNNHSTNIEFKNLIDGDLSKKETYIFNCITAIFSAIQEEFCEVDEEVTETEEIDPHRKIILFDMAACAGNGFYMGDGDVQGENYEANNNEADFAVRISGRSMEPTIPNGSIVLVKRAEVLENNNIGIFNIDGNSMCKRYTHNGDVIVLVPVNKSEEFKEITITSDMNCSVQGKVIEVVPLVVE